MRPQLSNTTECSYGTIQQVEADFEIFSDCQGFWNPHGLWVGYRQVWVWVQIYVPTTYKMSPRTSKTDRNWWTYGPNSRKYCLAHISVISGPFWLFLGSKTCRVAGKGPWGKGTMGWEKKPQGYPQQSLEILRYKGGHMTKEFKAKFFEIIYSISFIVSICT